ncbi:MAG TPA: hypothetical protein VD866_01540 [Urbifossiella sp.]|nr:hypothetical protein [Urbifossiella sp.]
MDRWRVLSGPMYICPDCRDHLVDDLTEVARRYPLLDARYGVDPEARGGPGFGSRAPGRVDVWTARDERSLPYRLVEDYVESDTPIRSVARTLATWADLIVETRGEETAPPRTVFELTRWLVRRIEYIARWPDDGPELARDIRQLRNQLRSLTGEPNPKPAAYCIRFEPGPDGTPTECGAAIFGPPPTVDRTSAVSLWCTGDPRHRYTGTEILRLIIANEGRPG